MAYIPEMTVRTTHILILFFVTALSAHMAHEVVAHEDAVCEVCLHVQSLDDALPVADLPHSQLIDRSNQQNQLWINAFIDTNHQSIDSIRGPPQFSSIHS